MSESTQPPDATDESHRENQYHVLLSRLGPQTTDELGRQPHVDARRVYDIWQFNPLSTTTPVWYLNHVHDTESVLRKWISVNRSTLTQRDVTSRTLTYKLSRPFKTAWNGIKHREEFSWLRVQTEPNSSEQRSIRCPKCGQPQKNLPNHLPTCTGSDDSETA